MDTSSKTITTIILSDGKVGHLKQSLAVAHFIIDHSKIQIIPFSYKNILHRFFLTLLAYLPLPLSWKKFFLPKKLIDPPVKPGDDKNCVVISTGSSIAPLTFLYSKIHSAKSIVNMRPPLGLTYDLKIIPRHDHPNPSFNTVITLGAPTTVSEINLEPYAQKLYQHLPPSSSQTISRKMISVFIGEKIPLIFIQKLDEICRSKEMAQNMDLLITTSRRTSEQSIQKIKTTFLHHPYCRLLMIPTESSQPEGLVEGMLGLAELILVTGDSISMISEAASSGKKVIVIETDCLKKYTKHREMIQTLVQEGYITASSASDLDKVVIEKLADTHPVKKLQDSVLIKEALQRLLYL